MVRLSACYPFFYISILSFAILLIGCSTDSHLPSNPNTTSPPLISSPTSSPALPPASSPTSPSTSPLVSSSFTFAVTADIGAKHDAQVTLHHIGQSSADFFLVPGDLAYSDVPESTWCSLVQNETGAIKPMRIYLLAGNHDDDDPKNGAGGNIHNYTDCIPTPKNVIGDISADYYFDEMGLARFIQVIPNIIFDGTKYTYAKNSAEYNWTRDTIHDARLKGIPWVIVSMHENCLTLGVKSCEIDKDFFDMLFAQHVDLILQGHDHDYQRTKQLLLTKDCPSVVDGKMHDACISPSILSAPVSLNTSLATADTGVYVKGAGTILSIIGTGGAELYVLNRSKITSPYFAASFGKGDPGARKGYLFFTVNQSSLTGTFIGTTPGTFTDTFTIHQLSPFDE